MQAWSAAAVFLDAFGRQPELVATALDGLSDDDLAVQVEPGANTVAWLVWHAARQQDAQVAAAARTLGTPAVAPYTQEVWAQEGYRDRFALPLHDPKARFGDSGYGDTSEQMAAVRVSASQLTAYHEAVHERTAAMVAALADDDYATVVDDRWDPPVTLLVRLVSVVDDAAQHLGQAAFVRGVIQRRRGA